MKSYSEIVVCPQLLKTSNIKYWLYIYLLLCPSLVIASGEISFNDPRLTPEEVFKHVRQSLIDKEISADKYNLIGASYVFNKQRWIFLFKNKDPSFKDDIDISINENNLNDINIRRYNTGQTK